MCSLVTAVLVVYPLISPCREAQYLRRTLDSVAAQSVPPALWVVVDDGSTDETPAILEEYARRLPYLRVIRRTDRGGRQVAPGVIEAFYAGLEKVCLEDFDYLCKLDMDLDLPVRYFELLMQRMERCPRVGTTSGKPWFVHPQRAALVPEVCGDEMSVGMTKFYRVACKEIGGFVRQVLWDGIDCHRARMLGWIAESMACSVVAGHPGSRLTRIISRASRHAIATQAKFFRKTSKVPNGWMAMTAFQFQ
jgi:biofilm PGA synthesis N-glycosyltransferase PgaC